MKKKLLITILAFALIIGLFPMVAPVTAMAADTSLATIYNGEVYEFYNTSDKEASLKFSGDSESLADFLAYRSDGSEVQHTAMLRKITTYKNGHKVPAGGKFLVQLQSGASIIAQSENNVFEIRKLKTPVLYTQTLSKEGQTCKFQNEGDYDSLITWRTTSDPDYKGYVQTGLREIIYDSDGNEKYSGSAGVSSGSFIHSKNSVVYTKTNSYTTSVLGGDYTSFSGQPYRLTTDGEKRYPSETTQGKDSSDSPSGIVSVDFLAKSAGKDIKLDINWSDDLFKASALGVNRDLAIASVVLSQAAYDQNRVKDTLVKLGFDALNIRQEYNLSQDLNENRVAHSFASKRAVINGKETVIVAVVLRGTPPGTFLHNEQEWRANVFLPFEHAAESVTLALDSYMTEVWQQYTDLSLSDFQEVKFLVVGHSRGAAVANLLSAQLIKGLPQSNIFTYCFATPNTQSAYDPNNKNQFDYQNIFNILNEDDSITTNKVNYNGKLGINLKFSPSGITNFASTFYQLTGVAYDKSDHDHNLDTHLAWLLTGNNLSSIDNLDSASSWALDSIKNAVSANLVPQALQSNYTQAATRAEFCALAVALYENVTSKTIAGRTTFSDSNDVNVEKMASLGVVSGVGNNKFAPNDKLTREQAAVMLARLAEAIGEPLPQKAATFADNNAISLWAIEQVGQIQNAGIMSGVGNNMFSPKSEYTREQSIITIMRLYDVIR